MDGTEKGGFLQITIKQTSFSLPVSDVERVITVRMDEVYQVPFDESGRILGIFNDRGTVTAFIRCPGLFDASCDREEMTAVILRDKGRRFAIPADTVVPKTTDKKIRCLNAAMLYSGEIHGDDQ